MPYRRCAQCVAAGTLLFTASLPECKAQSSTTYLYDALSRLRSTENSRGVRGAYEFDKAGNRSNATARPNSLLAWEAEGLPHSVGYADRDGWAANVNTAAGHMTYGPYANNVPTGQRTASWRMAIDVHNASNDQLVTLDVYDATAGEQLAFRIVKRQEFLQNQTYQIFDIPFSMPPQRAGHSLELRTYYHGSSYVILDKILLY